MTVKSPGLIIGDEDGESEEAHEYVKMLQILHRDWIFDPHLKELIDKYIDTKQGNTYLDKERMCDSNLTLHP